MQGMLCRCKVFRYLRRELLGLGWFPLRLADKKGIQSLKSGCSILHSELKARVLPHITENNKGSKTNTHKYNGKRLHWQLCECLAISDNAASIFSTIKMTCGNATNIYWYRKLENTLNLPYISILIIYRI